MQIFKITLTWQTSNFLENINWINTLLLETNSWLIKISIISFTISLSLKDDIAFQAVLSCTPRAHLRFRRTIGGAVWLWLRSRPGAAAERLQESRGSTQQALAKFWCADAVASRALWQLDRAQGLFLFAWHFLPTRSSRCVNNVTRHSDFIWTLSPAACAEKSTLDARLLTLSHQDNHFSLISMLFLCSGPAPFTNCKRGCENAIKSVVIVFFVKCTQWSTMLFSLSEIEVIF